MILRRYLTRIFLGRAAAVLLGLAALLQLLDLLDKASDVLQRGGVADIGRYAALRMPTMLGQLVPLAVLVGAILTYRRLAGTLEIAAMRTLGLGAWRLVGALLPACVLAVMLQLALQLVVAPRSERALADWWDSHGVTQDQPITLAQRLWLRSGTEIASVEAVSLDGTVLAGLLLVRRDAQGQALDWVQADRAEYGVWDGTGDGAGSWRLLGTRRLHPGGTRPEPASTLPWPEGPDPAMIRDLARPTVAQPLDRLLAGSRGEGSVTRGPAFYATRVQATTASMAAPFVMLLLAVPAAFGMPRQEGAVRRGGIGLVLGLSYLVANGLMTALGEAGGVGPYVAAWTAPLCFALAGLSRLWRAEA